MTRVASMEDQLKFVFENAENLLEQEGVETVRRLHGQWVLDATKGDTTRTVMAPSLYEAFEKLTLLPSP